MTKQANISLIFKKAGIVVFLLFMLAIKAGAQSTTTEVQVVDVSLTNVIELTFVATGTNTGSTVSMPINTISEFLSGVSSST